MKDAQRTGSTAAGAVRDMAGQLSDWAGALPGPGEAGEFPSLGALGSVLKNLNSLHFQWVSTAAFRSTQGVTDPQHRDLTAAYALAASVSGDVLQSLGTALRSSAQLSVLDLRQIAEPEPVRQRIVQRGDLALSRTRAAADAGAELLARQAERLEHRYAGARLLSHEERAQAAQGASALAASTVPAATAPSRPAGSASITPRRSR
ncbi:hypothetical protein ABH940_005565 [Streptacidiphilus sp. BW17]|uniref:hypothetical protein n=1 Tax=Streptacidiphilus sp. BW17 TaxID=3156274 RepID=UPI003516F659